MNSPHSYRAKEFADLAEQMAPFLKPMASYRDWIRSHASLHNMRVIHEALLIAADVTDATNTQEGNP